MNKDIETSRLADKLYDYVNGKSTDGLLPTGKLEVKPLEFNETNKKSIESYTESPSEIIEKDKKSIITNENKIICDNILIKFFDLEDDKFFACLEKFSEWGFDICFKEFITDYYIRIIKDNRLRNYIMMHIDSLIMMLKERLERNMLNSLKSFNFTTTDDDQRIELIKNELKGKELTLLTVKAKNFDEYAPVSEPEKETLDPRRKHDARIAIMNRLRYENPELL